MSPEEVAEEVGEDVVDNDEHGGYYEVDETFENIRADEPAASGADKGGHDDPSKESELVFEETLFEAEYETEEADDKEGKTDKIMM